MATFTKRQRDVYEAVLAVMKFATSHLVAGNNIEDYHAAVGRHMEQELIKLDLLNDSDVKNQDPAAPLYKKYFMHGTSHYLGLDVHDVGGKYRTFEPGMVYTCEPGIYIREEGLGIRLENDILITRSRQRRPDGIHSAGSRRHRAPHAQVRTQLAALRLNSML